MERVYIIYYDFKNTSGNHAGMAYLSRYINSKNERVRLIKNPNQEFKFGRLLARLFAFFLPFYLFIILRKTDKVFFFEYLSKGFAYQDLSLKIMRILGLSNHVSVLVHLSGDNLLELYNSETVILQKLTLADQVYTLGSSLSNFIKRIGYSNEIVTTFHYVDTDYYRSVDIGKSEDSMSRLKVICMGSLKRNFKTLVDIIKHCPDVDFYVCMGKSNNSQLFADFDNVRVFGFLEEEELLRLMQSSQVGLSVLHDTIGSNVITTSLAVGLVQVVSDVGSIRDYCSENDSFFCNDVSSFVNAIRKLDGDRHLLESMQHNASNKARHFSKESFLEFFNKSIN
ncbi:glycosyltransferase [Flectobacillus major]|uniref:glycosyltransferase n=1 Tax=Flectobacillus major TaxID=103 RepID=UPI0003F8408F|nr:glycosyltransferase [Flectobacillus major]